MNCSFKTLIVAFGPFWPITLLVIVLMYKCHNEAKMKQLEILSKVTAKAHMITIFTLTLLQCPLQLYLMISSMTNTKWTNFVVWALMLIWFYKAQILCILVSLGLMAYYLLLSHHHYADMTTGCKIVYALKIIFASISQLLVICLFAFAMKGICFAYILIAVHLFISFLAHFAIDLKSTQDWKAVLSTQLFLGLLANLFICDAPHAGGIELFLKQFVMEFIIFLEIFIVWILLFISLDASHIVVSAVMWSSYWICVFLKILFFLNKHPCSKVFYDQMKSKLKTFSLKRLIAIVLMSLFLLLLITSIIGFGFYQLFQRQSPDSTCKDLLPTLFCIKSTFFLL